MARGKNHHSEERTFNRRHLLGLSVGTLSVGTTGLILWNYRKNNPLPGPRKITQLPDPPAPLKEVPELPALAESDVPTPEESDPASVPEPTLEPPVQPSEPIIPLPDEKDYAAFLAKLDLRYITPREIISAHRRKRNGVRNVLPPRKYWYGMIPTLKIADELRHRLGIRLNYIASAYRSPDYNAQCPGASPNSTHKRNIALDLVYDCSPRVAMAEAQKMRDEGLFLGGLGLYKTFIHIDTRGKNANWG